MFEQPIHDFGMVAPGSVQTCEFNFKNEGIGKLVINDVSKTCGCTVFTLEKKNTRQVKKERSKCSIALTVAQVPEPGTFMYIPTTQITQKSS